ncbi:hypothetical protein GCM10023340_09700 [Nocardioides marinquilinus]|uniref:Uncharacterized protein n=1 Tax=Nocardioides marinquilinus TaxID=1210400 RepID=A0ABP9PBG6_9ACTN
MSPASVNSDDVAVPVADRGRARMAAALGGLLVLGGVAFLAGAASAGPDEPSWQTGTGYVGEEIVTVESDGWSYGATDSVDTWWDEEGTLHSGGWPSCLTPGPHQVRFVAADLEIDGIRTRPIVAVDCRG